MKRKIAAIAAVSAAIFVHQASATPLIAEDFTGTGNAMGLQYTDPGSGTTIGDLNASSARSEGSPVFGAYSTTFFDLTAPINTESVYFSVLFTQPVADNWGGVSFFDGGTERLFFGNPGLPYVGKFSIDQDGGGGPGADQSGIDVLDDTTYFLVGAYDFDSGVASLWVNPTFSAIKSPADLIIAYAGGWSLTSVRIGADAVTIFDSLRVGTSWLDVVPATSVPEPLTSTLLLIGIAGLIVFRRRVRA